MVYHAITTRQVQGHQSGARSVHCDCRGMTQDCYVCGGSGRLSTDPVAIRAVVARIGVLRDANKRQDPEARREYLDNPAVREIFKSVTPSSGALASIHGAMVAQKAGQGAGPDS